MLHIKDVRMLVVLKSREATFALVACAMGMYNISFFTPFLAVKLKTYDLSDSQIGFCFGMASFPYFLSAISQPFLMKNVPRKVQFVACYIVSACSFALMGPSTLFHLPDKLFLLLIGMFFLGFIQALVFIPSLPEAIETF